MKIIPVILCGGSGTRLWPESREDMPKQFLKLMGNGSSLLQDTLLRAKRVSGTDLQNSVCVCLAGMADQVCEHIKELDPNIRGHILREPSARNTAAAVALAALYCQKEFGDETLMWVLPSDHYIGKEDVLRQALEEAKSSAEKDKLVTFGITPTRPETGYGYIKCSQAVFGKAAPVENFTEKPDFHTALSFLTDGTYLWNSGMFLFKPSAVVDAFSIFSPEILAAVRKSVFDGDMTAPDMMAYEKIPKIPFDKAIMEKSPDVTVVPSDMAWSDIGTWGSIWELSSKTENQNVIEGNVTIEKSRGCLVRSTSGRLVTCAGIEDMIVIDTKDSILVTRRTRT